MNVIHAGPRERQPATPSGFSLIRVRGADSSSMKLASDTMRAAEDDHRGTALRLSQGDEMFAWRALDGRIACFCWARFRDRAIGPVALHDRPGRVFLYNAHTLPDFRRRGLYRALLDHIMWTFTLEQHHEFIADVDRSNIASLTALDAVGFRTIASLTFVTVARRWQHQLWRSINDRSVTGLF